MSDSNKRYYTVIDGSFHTEVPENDPKAVRRDWKSPDGSRSGTKYERIEKALFGRITGVYFHDGAYGKNLNIVLEEKDGETPVISFATASRYGESFMKLLPSVSLEKPVRIMPYSFIPEGQTKEKTGVSVAHQDPTGKFTEKVGNFFWDEATQKPTHGFPVIEDSSKYDKEDWKIHFLQVRKFMVNYIQENICSKFSEETKNESTDYPEVNSEDVPFN